MNIKSSFTLKKSLEKLLKFLKQFSVLNIRRNGSEL